MLPTTSTAVKIEDHPRRINLIDCKQFREQESTMWLLTLLLLRSEPYLSSSLHVASLFTKERGHHRCPRKEIMILGADAAESEELRIASL